MRVARHLEHILKTKGLVHNLERSLQILYRFSRGRRTFDRMIDRLESDLAGTRITFCSAASLLAEHRDAFERLDRGGHELAAHGFFHSRMDYLDYQGQSRILGESHQEFEKAGFKVAGFRCPYLNFNDDTIEALQASNYDWTSQEIVFWQNGRHPGTERLEGLYHTRQAEEKLSLPVQRGRILEIPITAPDDEMLIERMRVRDASQIEEVWRETFLKVYEKGELCHFLFHPERFSEIVDPLRAVVALAASPQRRVWLATIGEICAWWRQRQQIRWQRQPSPSIGKARIQVHLPERTRLLLKDPNSAASSRFYRDYISLEAVCQSESGGRVFEYESREDPTVWIAPGCPAWLSEFLSSEGFLVVQSRKPGCQALKVDPAMLGKELNRRAVLEKIEASSRPLLRIWRWPDDARAALTISSDVDSITLRDFWRRVVHF